MRRRDFLIVAGSAGVAWPRRAPAQQRPLPVVGYLHPGSPEARMHLVEAFRKGVAETGHVDGKNVIIELHWAHNDPNQVQVLAAELVRRNVSVIVTPIGTATAVAVKAATSTIPIVFSTGADAVKAGLVQSYNRPGGNATGVGAMVSELGAKRLGLLRELRPQARTVGLLVNPNNPVVAEAAIKDTRGAAASLGVTIEVVTATNPDEIDKAFDTLVAKKAGALIVNPDPLVGDRRTQLATLAARHSLPTIYPLRDFAAAGGLLSYGPDDLDRYRLVGTYVGRILKGEKPAEMPVQRPTKFQLVINLQTAKTLGIAVPPTLLARADEVIE